MGSLHACNRLLLFSANRSEVVLGAGLVLIEGHELIGLVGGVQLASNGREAVAGRREVEPINILVAVVAAQTLPFLVRVDCIAGDHQALARQVARSELHVGGRTVDHGIGERELDIAVVAAGVVTGAVVSPGVLAGEVVAVLVKRAGRDGRCEIRIALAREAGGVCCAGQGGKRSCESSSSHHDTGHFEPHL